MTKKVINETELIKREKELKKELEEIKWKLDRINNPESTYEFEGRGEISMNCTIEANSQKEAEELAREVLQRAIAWAINYTEGDHESGNFFGEFDSLRNKNGDEALVDANIDSWHPSDTEVTFICGSKNVKNYEDHR